MTSGRCGRHANGEHARGGGNGDALVVRRRHLTDSTAQPITGSAVGEITGVTVTAVSYGIVGDTIESVHLVVEGNPLGVVIRVGFGGVATSRCVAQLRDLSSGPSTAYDCAVSQPVALARQLRVTAG